MRPGWSIAGRGMTERCADDVEADVRVLMAKHAKIEPRGWTTAQQRAILHKRIDAFLDEHAIRLGLSELSEAVE